MSCTAKSALAPLSLEGFETVGKLPVLPPRNDFEGMRTKGLCASAALSELTRDSRPSCQVNREPSASRGTRADGVVGHSSALATNQDLLIGLREQEFAVLDAEDLHAVFEWSCAEQDSA